ncbi:hypothetical protein PAHAL_6G019300 [Panicum hallii]|jgi:hypothetical protein|uniref:Pectinesterase inhibitor domain-containing protein n=1 Tax=Panicum hallii TaxID=206008 RepID=A0A270R6W9_9POAL|nr:hypothetical protein PAHAL_6G019300 [Panicum hallii]
MFLLVWVALSLSSTIVAGGDCPGAHRNMTMEAACREATATATAGEPMYQVCMHALGDDYRAGAVKEAYLFAYDAAWRAVESYGTTEGWAQYVLGNGSLTGDEKAAYGCVAGGSYREAEAAMGKVTHRVGLDCGLDLSDEYRTALRNAEACRDRLAKLPPSPLLTMVEEDYNSTLLAYLLGKLLGIK